VSIFVYNIESQKYKTPVKELNLPAFSYSLKKNPAGQKLIFDRLRKKYVALTPEEWVRQHFINYLIEQKGFPPGLLSAEVTFRFNDLVRRADILAYSRSGNPILIVECKSPDTRTNKKVFDQIAEYNMKFRLGFLIVTNGLDHYACQIDWEKSNYSFLDEIPEYETLIKLSGE